MKIGEFSQLTGIPIKTIRYYCDINLIIPRYLPHSNYRQFGIEQLSQINRIMSLKQSGFTLKEITAMSEDELSDDAMLRILEAKLIMARNEQKQANAKVRKLKVRISNLKNIDSKENNMKNGKLTVPPFHNTLIGLVRSAVDYYDIEYSDAVLYGASGQAFLINIHKELCPSGPYVWNYEPFYKLVKNMGIDMTDHGMFTGKNTEDEINAIEQKIKELMDEGKPCGLANLENQMILGYDEKGFDLSQPWGGEYPVPRMTYGTWDEFKEDKFACFYSFDVTEKAGVKKIFADSLEYAIDLSDNHTNHSREGYTTGIPAYDTAIEAVEKGFGSSHGNWWNFMVWSECRLNAAEYFAEMKDVSAGIEELCLSLSNDYKLIAEGLNKAADKSTPIKPKVELLKEIKQAETDALDKIRELLKKLK